MEIITKFHVGDKVWVLRDKHACRIKISVIFYDGEVEYSDSHYNTRHKEGESFGTKEELIAFVAEEILPIK